MSVLPPDQTCLGLKWILAKTYSPVTCWQNGLRCILWGWIIQRGSSFRRSGPSEAALSYPANFLRFEVAATAH